MTAQESYYPERLATRDAVIRSHLLSPFTEIAAMRLVPGGTGSRSVSFRAALRVGEEISLPEQDFYFEGSETGGYLQNAPNEHWPVVRIGLSLEEQGKIEVHYPDSSVEAGVITTRLLYGLKTYKRC